MTDMVSVAKSADNLQPEPKGLGGWLFLPVVATLIWIALHAWVSVWPIAQVIGPTSWREMSGLETAIGLLFTVPLLVAWVWACVLLIRKKKLYPLLFVLLSTLELVLGLLDLYMMFEETRSWLVDSYSYWDVINALLIPYMLLSKRVRNTFVN